VTDSEVNKKSVIAMEYFLLFFSPLLLP